MGVLKKLRITTHDVHERLHAHPMLSNLITENLTLNDHLWVLFSFERFYESLSNQIDFELIQEKLRFIRKDIQSLGHEDNPLPICACLKTENGPNHTLGIQYVIIGSALGGSLISKNIEKQLGLLPGNGNSYFGSSPTTARKYWGDYQATLEKKCTNIQNCSESALKTFEALEKWLWHVCELKKKRF